MSNLLGNSLAGVPLVFVFFIASCTVNIQRETTPVESPRALEHNPDQGKAPEEQPRPTAAYGQRQPGAEWRDPVTRMMFAWVPGGCFQLGRTAADGGQAGGREVCVDGFWMGKYEVTQGQWRQVMANNPAYFPKGDNYPVESISWYDVQNFIEKLNARGRNVYRLPTEAEWEYACRSGGRQEIYCGGNEVDQVAWYANNSHNETHPVGQQMANGLGLYDMSGNVWEWVADNPKNSTAGADQSRRGGSWFSGPAYVSATFRSRLSPHYRANFLGFRLLRTN